MSLAKQIYRKEVFKLAELVELELLGPVGISNTTEFEAAQGPSKRKIKELADSSTEEPPWVPEFQ